MSPIETTELGKAFFWEGINQFPRGLGYRPQDAADWFGLWCGGGEL